MLPIITDHYQLSSEPAGHCLHHTKCFSPDDAWIVFDNRNNDPGIGSSDRIAMISSAIGEVCAIYQTGNHTAYGPGVGAVSFSPVKNEVLFIHGLRNCDAHRPYAFNRRTAVIINIDEQHSGIPQLIFPDARNITAPFTPGALRGGTHAHLWDNEGSWISFTYDDYIMDQLSEKLDWKLFKRTVGIMIPDFKVEPESSGAGFENHPGSMFSFIIASTTTDPQMGSDEIDTAFDETWVGDNGYLKADGSWQKRAVAFQGNVLNEAGIPHTELFVADLPDVFKAEDFVGTEGTESTPPTPPKGLVQRRITFSESGISAPRHWLRCSGDGSQIYYLNRDDNGVVQLYAAESRGSGKVRQVSFHQASIEGPFNLSPDGKYAAYIHQNSVTITNLSDGASVIADEVELGKSRAAGAVIWSNSGNMLAYNRYVKQQGEEYLQIFLVGLQW